MTKGIQVVWHDANGRVDEMEYLYGIDVDDLDRIPPFRTVPSVWPRENGGTAVEYVVDMRSETRRNGEVRLQIRYDAADNAELAARGDINWGTNTIILVPGSREGRCQWRKAGASRPKPVQWQSFDLAAAKRRRRKASTQSERDALFRRVVLASDGHRCTITGDATAPALEAAHLVPAKTAENDVPSNGIALRADLHRLFDAGVFTFAEDGTVVLVEGREAISTEYCELLARARLDDATLDRVRPTLTLLQFRNR